MRCNVQWGEASYTQSQSNIHASQSHLLAKCSTNYSPTYCIITPISSFFTFASHAGTVLSSGAAILCSTSTFTPGCQFRCEALCGGRSGQATLCQQKFSALNSPYTATFYQVILSNLCVCFNYIEPVPVKYVLYLSELASQPGDRSRAERSPHLKCTALFFTADRLRDLGAP